MLCSENQTNRPYLEFVTIDFSIFLVTDASSGDSNSAQGGSFNQTEIFLFLKFSEFCLKLFEFCLKFSKFLGNFRKNLVPTT